jgi:hypothetical protein
MVWMVRTVLLVLALFFISFRLSFFAKDVTSFRNDGVCVFFFQHFICLSVLCYSLCVASILRKDYVLFLLPPG